MYQNYFIVFTTMILSEVQLLVKIPILNNIHLIEIFPVEPNRFYKCALPHRLNIL